MGNLNGINPRYATDRIQKFGLLSQTRLMQALLMNVDYLKRIQMDLPHHFSNLVELLNRREKGNTKRNSIKALSADSLVFIIFCISARISNI